MFKLFLIIGAILGILGVMIGAFGAHALNNHLEQHNMLDTFDTAVKYHFYHTLALLLTGILLMKAPSNYWLIWSGWAFLTGVLIFSGSLYVMSITGFKWLGAITPLGGLAFIFGWTFMVIGVARLPF